MTESYQFDVLYLGAGHGAFDGAVPLANSGKKVSQKLKDFQADSTDAYLSAALKLVLKK